MNIQMAGKNHAKPGLRISIFCLPTENDSQ